MPFLLRFISYFFFFFFFFFNPASARHFSSSTSPSSIIDGSLSAYKCIIHKRSPTTPCSVSTTPKQKATQKATPRKANRSAPHSSATQPTPPATKEQIQAARVITVASPISGSSLVRQVSLLSTCQSL